MNPLRGSIIAALALLASLGGASAASAYGGGSSPGGYTGPGTPEPPSRAGFPPLPAYTPAAPPAGCPDGNICLYDGKNYTGAWNRHGCDREWVPFLTRRTDIAQLPPGTYGGDSVDDDDAKFFKRVSSVYGRCPASKMWGLVFHPDGQSKGELRWMRGDFGDPDLSNDGRDRDPQDGLDNANSVLADIKVDKDPSAFWFGINGQNINEGTFLGKDLIPRDPQLFPVRDVHDPAWELLDVDADYPTAEDWRRVPDEDFYLNAR